MLATTPRKHTATYSMTMGQCFTSRTDRALDYVSRPPPCRRGGAGLYRDAIHTKSVERTDTDAIDLVQPGFITGNYRGCTALYRREPTKGERAMVAAAAHPVERGSASRIHETTRLNP